MYRRSTEILLHGTYLYHVIGQFINNTFALRTIKATSSLVTFDIHVFTKQGVKRDIDLFRILTAAVNRVIIQVTGLGVAGGVIAQRKSVITCMDVI